MGHNQKENTLEPLGKLLKSNQGSCMSTIAQFRLSVGMSSLLFFSRPKALDADCMGEVEEGRPHQL